MMAAFFSASVQASLGMYNTLMKRKNVLMKLINIPDEICRVSCGVGTVVVKC